MQDYQIKKVAKPEFLPLEIVKNYLRVTEKHDDQLIETMTSAAIETAEGYLRVSLLEREVVYEVKPTAENLQLPLLPVLKVTKITIKNEAESQPTTEYVVKNTKLQLARTLLNKMLQIEYLAGYAQDRVPASIKSGILLHIAQMYDHRVITNTLLAEVLALYNPYRRLLI